MFDKSLNINLHSLQETYNELLNDYELSKKLDADLYSEGFIKRTVIRSYFAMVEGTIFQLKDIAKQANAHNKVLNQSEEMLLNEVTVTIKENGKIEEKKLKTSLIPYILFTINCLNKVFGLNYSIVKNANYHCFCNAIKIRDRITHPKSRTSINLSDKEIQDFGNGNIWFRDTFTELMKLINTKLGR